MTGESMQDPIPSNSAADKNDGAPSTSAPAGGDIDEDVLKEFFGELKDVDRDNEVNRILWAFKLNPFEKLNLRFDAPLEEVRRQYRKLSLMVHPDKCKHPQASVAFDLLGEAQKELMDDERREALLNVLNVAREEVRKERKKETKHDSLVRVASLLNEAGREGVEAQWESSDEFHERWKLKCRELLANMEWRKRKLTKRLKDETQRAEKEAVEEKEKHKKKRQADKDWEATREERVGTWRDFMNKKGGKSTGELKPPKQKTHDEDRLYVQRPVTGEEFRPQAPPGMKTGAAKPRT